jgi:hypothetical protein
MSNGVALAGEAAEETEKEITEVTGPALHRRNEEIDFGTPWLAVPYSMKVPPDAAHLPERFGLFTLILLGESVVAVMQGMESQDDRAGGPQVAWPPGSNGLSGRQIITA